MKATLAALLAGGLIVSAPSLADDRPPQNAQPLSAIVAALEKQGYGPFREIEFEDGRWEVEVYRGDERRKLEVDPVSGRILSDEEDD